MSRIQLLTLTGLGALILQGQPLPAQTWSMSGTTSVDPYFKPSAAATARGYRIHATSLMTVQDPLIPAIGGYRMVGIPDGLGAFDNGDGTFTVLMNHEVPGGAGAGGNPVVFSVTNAQSGVVTLVTNAGASGITRAYGGKGGFVSEWVINRTNLNVISGRDFNLPGQLYVWDATNLAFRAFAPESDYHVSRLCSADLPAVTAFYNPASGLGTPARIFLNGEEDGGRRQGARAFAHVASGPERGLSYELPYLGYFPWENAVACPTPQDLTIVVGLEDGGLTDSQVYVYTGMKRAAGLEIEKAGLHGGNTYVLRVDHHGQRVTNETNDRVLGVTNRVTEAPFTLVDEGDISAVSQTDLAATSLANGTSFQRVEDGAWDPTHPNDFYFVTTARAAGADVTNPTRLWRLRFSDLSNPAAGGTITMVIEGATGPGQGINPANPVMWDNLGILADGRILLQEDPGGNARLAKVWIYDPRNGELVDVFTADPRYFQSGASRFLTLDEEATGIIDASDVIGPGWVLFAVQAHYRIAGELYEGGQLMAAHLDQAPLNAPGSQAEPYYKPVAATAAAGGFHVTAYSLLTVGETNGVQAGYPLVGLPDGLGLLDREDGTFSLLVGHEINGGNLPGGLGTITYVTNATTGVVTTNNAAARGITRAYGGRGAFVSEWTFDRTNLAALSGSDLTRAGGLFLHENGAYRPFDAVNDYHISRLCSADLPAVTAFYNPESGRGTMTRLFLNGEEDGAPFRPLDGRAFAHVATGPDKGASYELPWLGKMAFENVVACPVPQDQTIVVGLDDAELTNSQVYVYIGRKGTSGTDLEKAGLANGQLYGLKVWNAGQAVRAENNTNVFGTTARSTFASFTLYPFGDVSAMSGAELDASSLANLTSFQRVEDGAWDPAHPNDFYFLTTGRLSGTNVTHATRLWRLCFADVMNPLAGGTIEMVLEGPAGTGNAMSMTQPVMMDNLCVLANDGGVVIQEDPGNTDRLAKVWHYDTVTGQLTLLAEADRKFFATGGSAFQTRDEESSGILDASEVLGPGWLLMDVQSHTSVPGELVERGQLMALHLDRVAAYPSVRVGPSSQTVGLGAGVTLSVTPAGTGPFTYQWFRNGVALNGATGASLMLYSLALDQAGTQYTVAISSPEGTVISAPAVVKVNPVTPVVGTPNVYFSMVIQGTVGATYRIEARPAFNAAAPFTTVTNLVLPSSPYLWIDTNAPATKPARVYRVAIP